MTDIYIGGHNYEIIGNASLLKGKRAIVRSTRPSQPSDSQLMVRRWKVAGPLGLSRQGENGELGVEYATLDHRFPDLLTSLPAVNAVNITGDDPIASGTAALGAMPLGGRALGGGSSLGTPLTVTHVKENMQRLFVARGAFRTQVNIGSWAVEQTKQFNGAIRGLANWFMKLRTALGDADALQTTTGITTAGATDADTQVSASDVYANELYADSNRLTMVRADPDGTNANRIRWTYDDFATLSGGASGAGFFVGDKGIPSTGIGSMGPYTVVAGEAGVYAFTPEGVTFNLIRALQDARHVDNGRKGDEQFGWKYTATTLGLYASRGQTSNPVGIGSPAWRHFEGFDGKPTAVKAWRELLLVAYESSAGTTWRILAGEYAPGLTDATGELNWYLLASRTVGSVREIFATSTPTNPNLGWGEGANALARIVMGRGGGRDITDSNYVYSTSGGQWFGSTLMEQPQLRKTVRWGRFVTENCTNDNPTPLNTFTLALAFDGGSYSNVGSAVATNGAQKVVPATPTSAPTGFRPKPRLTQVAGSSSSPPQIRGDIEIAFDVRPDKVDEIKVMVGPLKREQVNVLRALADGESSTGRQPVLIRLPGQRSTAFYGFVTGVDDEDSFEPEVPACTVTLITWDAS